jgi:hypothetical protein
MSRKTSAITYDLKDRNRKHTGQDRSNLDIKAMVQQINSARVQEMVSKGDLLGYYGHQVRQKFGMFPPETAVIQGKLTPLIPAIRTIELSASEDGVVTHRQEFLSNPAGEVAFNQYSDKVGGFSTASDYARQDGKLKATNFAGFDYVWQANYATNTSFGVFDGLVLGEIDMQVIPPEELESQILQCYDNIARDADLRGENKLFADRIAQLEEDSEKLRQRLAAKSKRRKERQVEIFDSLICPTVEFDPNAHEKFLTATVARNEGSVTKESDMDISRGFGGFGGLGSLFGFGK